MGCVSLPVVFRFASGLLEAAFPDTCSGLLQIKHCHSLGGFGSGLFILIERVIACISASCLEIVSFNSISAPGCIFVRFPENIVCLQALRVQDLSMILCLRGRVCVHTVHDLTGALSSLPQLLEHQLFFS